MIVLLLVIGAAGGDPMPREKFDYIQLNFVETQGPWPRTYRHMLFWKYDSKRESYVCSAELMAHHESDFSVLVHGRDGRGRFILTRWNERWMKFHYEFGFMETETHNDPEVINRDEFPDAPRRFHWCHWPEQALDRIGGE